MSKLLALMTLACAALVPGSALAASPGTKVVHFKAFDLSGRTPGIHVDRTLRGSCFAGSIGMPRPDAWRCMVGNEILDPCLQAPEGAAPLICLSGSQVIRLNLTKALPFAMRNKDEGRFFAWRLVLQGGDVCDALTGTAAGVIQGHGLSYACRSGGVTTEPLRGHAFWTVRYLPKGANPSGYTRLSQLKLRKVAQAIG
jgi:hypothetical protein